MYAYTSSDVEMCTCAQVNMCTNVIRPYTFMCTKLICAYTSLHYFINLVLCTNLVCAYMVLCVYAHPPAGAAARLSNLPSLRGSGSNSSLPQMQTATCTSSMEPAGRGNQGLQCIKGGLQNAFIKIRHCLYLHIST